MYLSYMRSDALEELQSSIGENLENYKSEKPWLPEVWSDRQWAIQSQIWVEDFSLKGPEGQQKFDLENTISLYSSLRHLNITQATDERLWTYLSHATYWEYMRRRWPVENYLGAAHKVDDDESEDNKEKNPIKNIRTRYFFMANQDRALLRNGLARLWWYGYVSYDPTREDPFELTAVLLSFLDITQNLLERSYSRNPIVTKAVLNELADRKKRDLPFPNRSQFRDLTKYINRIGGVSILDALKADDLKLMISDRLKVIGL